jgi:hypothetical protein
LSSQNKFDFRRNRWGIELMHSKIFWGRSVKLPVPSRTPVSVQHAARVSFR